MSLGIATKDISLGLSDNSSSTIYRITGIKTLRMRCDVQSSHLHGTQPAGFKGIAIDTLTNNINYNGSFGLYKE